KPTVRQPSGAAFDIARSYLQKYALARFIQTFNLLLKTPLTTFRCQVSPYIPCGEIYLGGLSRKSERGLPHLFRELLSRSLTQINNLLPREVKSFCNLTILHWQFVPELRKLFIARL